MNTGYYFVNCLRYAFNHSAELDGNHHSGFFSDLLEALKHGHKVRLKNPWNLSHFNLYIARLLIISLHTYFISRYFIHKLALGILWFFLPSGKGAQGWVANTCQPWELCWWHLDAGLPCWISLDTQGTNLSVCLRQQLTQRRTFNSPLT